MSFVNRLISSNAIGKPTSYLDVFSDLEEVGEWPSKENIIIKITKIEIWYNASRINGIKATYSIPGDTKTETHGAALDLHGAFELTSNEFIVGAFGALKNDENAEDHGALKRLGFLVYNNATGEISNKGPYPSPSGPDSVKGFSFLGNILGFGGTLSDSEPRLLDAIVFYKATDSDTTAAISG